MSAVGSWITRTCVLGVLWFILLGALGMSLAESPAMYWGFVIIVALIGLIFLPFGLDREVQRDENKYLTDLLAKTDRDILALRSEGLRKLDHVTQIDARTVHVDNRKIIIHGETPKEKQDGRKEERRIGSGSGC
jgi:sigma54-dependent transcription regulator